MKKTLIACSVLLFFAVTASAQTPTYKELSATAYRLLKEQDYIGAHKAFHTLDSLYGISDFEALYYYYSLSHDFVHDSEAEKALMFRLAHNKCCDMRYLDDWARSQQADTLDYWNDIVAIVAPRGYQDTVYQNRLLAMNNMPDFYFHPSLVDYRQYSLNLHIEGDTLRVSGFYLIPYETYTGQPIKVDTAYSLPLADYRTADGAIVLRREGNWYPHINGELLTAQVHIKADDYYILGGTEWLPSFDIHLVLLPKDKYACKVIDSPIRPFHFYRLASDTTQRPEAYYREFVDSYNFYCSFFGDTLTDKPMNIVEIGDPQFVMCQSLRDMIIFGHYFYDVYTMIPDFSWIPHEVAHQWWGDGIFFEYRDYALGESLNEYIKLQFLKSRGRGYEEQMEYYKTMMERAEKSLPIADIHSVESQDESIAIYHAAPYRLTLENTTIVNATLQQLYRKYKHTVVSRDMFLQECKTLQDWLKYK